MSLPTQYAPSSLHLSDHRLINICPFSDTCLKNVAESQKICLFDPRKISPTRAKNGVFASIKVEMDQKGIEMDQNRLKIAWGL